MKRVAEGDHDMGIAPRRQYSLDLSHHNFRLPHVFEHRIAFNTLEHAARERKLMRVSNHVHSGGGE